ncbi:MAG: tetratricopeptide repeat protein [Armatimonadetes bacterium]|nr:tetratricopeptide repeat protein [Armatimonadota bacterium]
MRTRFSFRFRPDPPPAGRVKLADPLVTRRRWLVTLAALVAAGVVAWPYGLGQMVDEMRRDVAATGYLRAAERHAAARPPRRAEALYELSRALALAPDRDAYAEAVATVYLSLRAYAEARDWLQREPDLSPLLRVNLGQCLMMTGEQEKGARLIRSSLAEIAAAYHAGQLPEVVYALALNNAGYALLSARENVPEARLLIARALAVSPLQPAYIDSMGWAEYQAGRYLDAAFYLERAVRLYWPQEDAEMQFHLGMAYARLGKLYSARQALERCLQLDPGWTEAQHQLESLRRILPPPNIAWQPKPGYSGISRG